MQPGQYASQPAPVGNPFADPIAGGIARPSIRHFANRIVIFMPTSYNPLAPGYEGAPAKPAVTFDAIVCDGGALDYGDDIKKTTPATWHMPATPALFAGCQSSNVVVVDSLAPRVASGQPVIARVVMGDRAWLLNTIDDQAIIAKAAALWVAHRDGTWKSPEPVDLRTPAQPAAPAATAAPAAVQYAQAYAPAQPVAAPADGGRPPRPTGWQDAIWQSLPVAQAHQIVATMAASGANNGGVPAAVQPQAQPAPTGW